MELSFEWQRGRAPRDMRDALEAFGKAIEEELLDEWAKFVETVRKRTQSNSPVDTGALRDSYEDMVEWIKTSVLEGRVETEIPYAAFQEFIYTPHLAPAMEESVEEARKHVEKAWNRAVRRVS